MFAAHHMPLKLILLHPLENNGIFSHSRCLALLWHFYLHFLQDLRQFELLNSRKYCGNISNVWREIIRVIYWKFLSFSSDDKIFKSVNIWHVKFGGNLFLNTVSRWQSSWAAEYTSQVDMINVLTSLFRSFIQATNKNSFYWIRRNRTRT